MLPDAEWVAAGAVAVWEYTSWVGVRHRPGFAFGTQGPSTQYRKGPPLRVLHVYRTYLPDTQGGLEETIRQVCVNTQVLGAEHRVLALTMDASRRAVRRAEARVFRARQTASVASCGVSIEALAIYRRLVRWADVIHYHFPWPFGDLLHLALAPPGKPSLVTYHSDIVRQRLLRKLYRPLMDRFLGSVDRIVATSPNYFATSDVLSRFERKVEIVPIGLREDTYPAVSEAALAAARERYGAGFFLFVGVLRYYKGLHILLDAMAGAPYNVVIVGSGPTERQLKLQARRLGLANVKFAGQVPDAEKVALLRLSRGIVFPSYLRSEAFGVTLLEGAMFGKPLISTEVGSGTSHVNVDGETGLVVTPGSAAELRRAMDRLHHNPDLAGLMGRNARRRFEALFTGDLMGTRYDAIYRKLCGEAEQERENTPPVVRINRR